MIFNGDANECFDLHSLTKCAGSLGSVGMPSLQFPNASRSDFALFPPQLLLLARPIVVGEENYQIQNCH